MRLGLISDIHGNLLALDAVLEELERDGIDQIVCLGDVAVGPQPAEALARVRELGCPVVMGNWDAAFISGMPEPKDQVGEMLVEIGNWWAAFLSPDDRTFMESFQPTVDLMLGSTPALAFHGSPKSYDDWIFSTTPDEELRPLLIDTEATVLLGGHTHLQMMRRYEDSLIVNPGKRRPALPRVVAAAGADLAVGRVRRRRRRQRPPEHRPAAHAVRRRRVPRAEPRVGDAARRVVGQLLGAGLAQRREIVVTVPSGAMRRMWPAGPASRT